MALSKIDVANMVTGAVPVANGGTALTSGFVNGSDPRPLSQPIIINGDGSAKRRFTHVKDLAKGHLLALDSRADNQIYNLEGDKDVTIKELADLVSLNIQGVKIEYIVDKSRAGELKTDSIEISNQKIKKELGWNIDVSIEDGVKSYIDWFKNNN